MIIYYSEWEGRSKFYIFSNFSNIFSNFIYSHPY